ncbi:hypothetical protein [Nocardioides houyundeii]|uniref:hypothetical protein n=1 Tax=Nocardioides houyundeii TaxID=2045452 RepID=UPI000DF314CF|nr:hypothetical protein [Nocardioides houyundeii]
METLRITAILASGGLATFPTNMKMNAHTDADETTYGAGRGSRDGNGHSGVRQGRFPQQD